MPKIVSSTAVCKARCCTVKVLRNRAPPRRWKASLCATHWQQRKKRQSLAKSIRLRRLFRRINRDSGRQKTRAHKLWDILQGPQRAGQWTEPSRIIVAKATHSCNEGFHLAQSRGGAVKTDDTSVTIMNCMQRIRYKLKALQHDLGRPLTGADGIYVLAIGAKRTLKSDGRPLEQPAMHKEQWKDKASKRGMLALRCCELLNHAEAKQRWPRRADVGQYVSLVGGPKKAVLSSQYQRWGDAKRRTRLGPPILVSNSYRIFPLSAPGPLEGLTPAWDIIASIRVQVGNRISAPMSYLILETKTC